MERGALLRRMARYIEEDPNAADKLGKVVSTSCRPVRTRRLRIRPFLFAASVFEELCESGIEPYAHAAVLSPPLQDARRK